MNSLSACAPPIKPGSIPCPRCNSGPRRFKNADDSLSCWTCNDTSFIRVVEEDEPEPVCDYFAVSCDAVIDSLTTTEDGLRAFVADLVKAWRLASEDVAVWSRPETGGPRLIAVLRPGPRGKTAVVWMDRQIAA